MCESLAESYRDHDAPAQRRILLGFSPVVREVDLAAPVTAVVTLHRTTRPALPVVDLLPQTDVVHCLEPRTAVQDRVCILVVAAKCHFLFAAWFLSLLCPPLRFDRMPRHERRREKHHRQEVRVSATPRQKRFLAAKYCSVLPVSLIYVTRHPGKL